MDLDAERRHLWGIELRYVLTWHLCRAGSLTVHELVAAVAADGFALPGRPSKTISDALRWEIRRGRAVRLGRGRYGPGRVPRQTAARIRDRVLRLHEEIVATTWAD